MKAARSLEDIVAFVIAFSGLWGCTSNPFGDDEISGRDRVISGVVQLSDNLSPKGVYVWLEGFNVGSRADEQGNFQIVLPPPDSQSSSGGVSGVFNLYFYMANFNLITKPVIVRNGMFVYSQGEIDKNGKFNNPIFLSQTLSINTEMRPAIVPSDTESLISARVTLRAIKDTVAVFFPVTVGQYLAPLIFKNIVTEETFIIQFALGGVELSDFLTVNSDPRTRLFVTGLSPGDLSIGTYEVIPYLFVKDDNVPQELINSIGERVEELGPDYLLLPFLRDGGEFEVKLEENN
jgi:hypothetical protein